jgi:DNA replication and repair protein RecF
MRAVHLVARGFRNLADLGLDLPPEGAAFLGPNGHGKTSLLEALYYPVLCRSLRGASDAEVARWDGPGFHVALRAESDLGPVACETTYTRDDRKKQLRVGGAEVERLVDAVGRWLAVVFLPTDLNLVQGAAAARRQYLDRVLSLTDPPYLRALLRYRAGLAQRNAALRSGRGDLARAFGGALAEPGGYVVGQRLAWVRQWQDRYLGECAALGEAGVATMRYRGDAALADPAAWPEALDKVVDRELGRGMTLVGPQRGGRSARSDPPASTAPPRSRSSSANWARWAKPAAPSQRSSSTTCSPSWTGIGSSVWQDGCAGQE